MKKIVQLLLMSVLTVSSTYIQAKNFLMPRPQGVNLALENTAGWHDLINKKAPDLFGGHLQVAGFYQRSTNNCLLGQYFGIKEHSTVSLGRVNIGANPAAKVIEQDFDILYMLHQFDNAIVNNDATVNLAPEQTVSGAYVTYYQNLDTLLKGLYFNLVIPVVRVENDLNFEVSGLRSSDVRKFFVGTYKDVTIFNAQDPLKKALMNGCKSVEVGVADIDFMFGYAFWDKQYAHASLNLGITIPTGNQPRGEHVFEAVVGNGRHHGFGIGGDLWVHVWGDLEHNLKWLMKVNYRYLFASKEIRTLGLRGRDWGQYHLLGSILDGENNRGIPAANILTRRVEVTPGSQVDLITALTYNCPSFCQKDSMSFDLGYNLYFREHEAVVMKDCIDAKTYGVLARNYSFAIGKFTGASNQIDDGKTTLTNDDIDTCAAETPRQLTHKIYGGASYRIDRWETPILLGVGGHGEFACRCVSNVSLETWGVHGKVGVKF